jgi:hypothetical protein
MQKLTDFGLEDRSLLHFTLRETVAIVLYNVFKSCLLFSSDIIKLA